ncbi:hypothetical protein [Microlunatus sp. Y2014]|uniref:hypothetical protein n=1 Tax=Microlunatus sp. Y2014 TaxID=3418488 RepID=UPI003DA72C03
MDHNGPDRTAGLTMTRRTALAGMAGLAGAAAVGIGRPAIAHGSPSQGTELALIEPLDLKPAVDRATFAPEEQIFGSFQAVLAPLTNSIMDAGDTYTGYTNASGTFVPAPTDVSGQNFRGWFADGWHRPYIHPINTLIMQHVQTLAWFATHERPWNRYFGDPALIARLEAALQYYLSLQQPSGAFPEYTTDLNSMTASGFGQVSLAECLGSLQYGDILTHLHQPITDALRRCSTWVLTNTTGHWASRPVGLWSVNQQTSGLAGVTATAHVLGDTALADSIYDKLHFISVDGQAPAGYFHEARSQADHGYNMSVMAPELAYIHQLSPSARVRDLALTMAERYIGWVGYASVFEPGAPDDGALWFSASASRQPATHSYRAAADVSDTQALNRHWASLLPGWIPHSRTVEEVTVQRDAWAALGTTPVDARRKGDTSPRLMSHVPLAPGGGSEAEFAAGKAMQPYLADDDFTWVGKAHANVGQEHLFVRRPAYYAGSLWGSHCWFSTSNRQRMGLQMVWHPIMGMIIWGENDLDRQLSWDTTLLAGTTEVENFAAQFGTYRYLDGNGNEVDSDALPGLAAFTVRGENQNTTLGSDGLEHTPGHIRTDVTFDAGSITRRVNVDVGPDGSARDTIPLLLGPAPDEVHFVVPDTEDACGRAGWCHPRGRRTRSEPVPVGETSSARAVGLTVQRNGITCALHWAIPLDVTLTQMGRSQLGKATHVLTLPHSGVLTTTVTFE